MVWSCGVGVGGGGELCVCVCVGGGCFMMERQTSLSRVYGGMILCKKEKGKSWIILYEMEL